jgi:beta-glucosidase
MVTLHHFTNPVWFAEKGGWMKRENIPYFTDFVLECKRQLGDLADFWITINEPNVLASSSLFLGEWPPFKRNPVLMARAFLNMAHAHNEAYAILRGTEKPVGSATHMSDYQGIPPFNRLLNTILNHSFLDLTRMSNDFIGLNYYRPYYVLPTKESQSLPRSDFGWHIDARGIFNVTMQTWTKYKLPIIITENGIADAADTKRARYIIEHLQAVKGAIDKGAEVKGYYHWSLLDNYEWAEGYKMKFGLFSVNPKTMERIPRKSAQIYADICSRNSLAHLT